MRIKLYELLMVEKCKWGGEITPYIRIELELNIKEVFFFVVSVADKSFCFRNPITALIKALECETVAAAKYVRLKGLRANATLRPQAGQFPPVAP